MATFRLLAILAGLTLLLLGLFSLARFLPPRTEEDALLEPRIHTVPDGRMLVFSGRGDPSRMAGQAFGSLFKAYYKSVKGGWFRRPPAPRARWDLSLEGRPKDEWQGRYALPLPEGAEVPAGGGLSVEDWEYGEVAEVLHVGPYHAEAPAILRLKDYIRQQGYRIVGDHEEIYLKGPGMFSKGNPARYRTLIRYRVEKAGP